jgi:hypothetical protein
MLGDHAWNGKDDASRRENAALRKGWAGALVDAARDLAARAWETAGLVDRSDVVTLFNPSGFSRRDVVRLALPPSARPKREALGPEGHALPSQYVLEADDQAVLYFTPPSLGPWVTATVGLAAGGPPPPTSLRASPTTLEGPFYRLTVDPRTGGLASLVHKPTGRELVVPGPRTLAQTVYFDGREAPVTDVESDVETVGPVLGRLHISCRTGPAETDSSWRSTRGRPRGLRVLCRQEAEPARGASRPRLPGRGHGRDPAARHHGGGHPAAPGARRRPRPRRERAPVRHPGLRRRVLCGRRRHRRARRRLPPAGRPEPLSFEALGTDQNFEEVSRDQGGATEFRFRYALRAHAGDYDGADTFAWSRSVATPIEARRGRISRPPVPGPSVDPARAIAIALKPADDPSARGLVLRVRETAGRTGPLPIAVPRWRRAVRLDLLEREKEELPIVDGVVRLELAPQGFAAVRLE